MKIKHLREWLESLPHEYDDYDMVFRNVIESQAAENWLVHDNPIDACSIDKETAEAYFCDDESCQLLLDIDENRK